MKWTFQQHAKIIVSLIQCTSNKIKWNEVQIGFNKLNSI